MRFKLCFTRLCRPRAVWLAVDLDLLQCADQNMVDVNIELHSAVSKRSLAFWRFMSSSVGA
jgi:hypothetical protein